MSSSIQTDVTSPSPSLVRSVKRRLAAIPPVGWARDVRRRMLRRSEGEAALIARFAADHGYALDLANPRTFTEKLFCRMVDWNRRMDPRFCELADKLAVRPYVSAAIGEEHLVPILWHGKDPRRIPFDRLPPAYVVKTNHGSAQVIAVRDGSPGPAEVVRRISEFLSTNLYWVCREYQYYRIPPQAMVEERLTTADGRDTLVYGFWCFDGVPRIVRVGDMARSMNPHFDADWNLLDMRPTRKRLEQPRLARPARYDRMLEIAAHLSAEFDFVRVDLYNVDGRIYFSELTFTPGAGWFQFEPSEWDRRLGDWWNLRR